MNTHNNISVCAPAKINLFLHVVGKREDGYHLLDSLVVFTECGDLIDVEAFDAISIEVVGRFAASLSNIPQEENLVWKAAMALQKYTHSNQGAHIRLTKNLPIGSGIGGGSADAAATIHALLKLWKLDIPQKNLSEIALTLGSDVPVCLYGKPALMRGIGDDLIPVTLQEKIYL
ncbi:MAG: 4-(cytidine 5'-diphospho)-2-C-methyl-D-erythritol kinase, partial [Rickettsiales bacterium]